MTEKHSGPLIVSAQLNGIMPADKTISDPALDSRKGVQSVEHAFTILQKFQESNRSLAVKEIAEACGMPASKVHHYLVSLVRCDVVQRSVDGHYELGTYALQLGLSALRRLDPNELAQQRARKLRDETGEATFISVWGSHGPTIIRYFEGSQPITVEAKTGNVLPLATSATGRVFVTWGSKTLIEPVLRQHDVAQSLIKKIRRETNQSTLGRVDGDLLPNISALAAPVFDKDSKLVLVITQLGWAGDFDCDLKGESALALSQAATQLSLDLGYQLESRALT